MIGETNFNSRTVGVEKFMREFLSDICAAAVFLAIAAASFELFVVRLTLAQVIDARIAAIPSHSNRR